MAKAELLDNIIAVLKSKLVIHEQVLKEATVKKELPAAQIINDSIRQKKIAVKSVENQKFCEKLMADFNLGKGEAEAITPCLGNDAVLISDDERAIVACKVLAVPFTTAPHLLVGMYKKKHLSQEKARAIAKKLVNYGRYSQEFIKRMEEDLQ